MARVPLLTLLLLLIALALPSAAPSAQRDNAYGVMMFPNPGEDFDLVLARARGLGVSWFRPPTVSVPRWTIGTPCPNCAAYQRSGLKLAITVRNTPDSSAQQPSHPPEDLALFGKKVASIVATMRPGFVAVENEENAPAFYMGSVEAYGAELAAACAAAHETRVACANGGLTGEAVAALAWLGYLEHGQAERACDFAKRALPREKLCEFHDAHGVPEALRARLIGQAGALVELYRKAPIDFVNFHWFGLDSRAFAETAEYLAHATNKSVVTNEFGQRRGTDNQQMVRPLLRAVIAENIPLAIWYSVNTADTDSLFGPDGRLRPTGWEFQRQLSGLR